MIEDISLTPSNRGVVYGLIASDEPLQIRYVGQTIKPPVVRLQGHYSRSASPGVCRWITEVTKRGASVRMRILGEYPCCELVEAEKKWIAFWSRYCALLNRVCNITKIEVIKGPTLPSLSDSLMWLRQPDCKLQGRLAQLNRTLAAYVNAKAKSAGELGEGSHSQK